MSVFDKESPAALFAAIAAGAAMKYAYNFMTAEKQNKTKYRYVGKVGEIWIYPIKSFKGIKVDNAEATQFGMKFHGFIDRHWACATADGVYLTQRQEPTMALIEPILNGDKIMLRAPGMDPISFPADPLLTESNSSTVKVKADAVQSVDLGEDVAAWLCKYFKREGLRLHYSGPTMEKRDTYKQKKPWAHSAKPGDLFALHDFCSYMMYSNASLKDLNSRLDTPVSAATFRGNVVFEDCGPFAEDAWTSIRIGDVQMRAIEPCTRCIMTTIGQDTGIKDKGEEPLKTLKNYRLMDPKYGQKPCFGMNYASEEQGMIKVGDPVYATLL